MAQATKTRTSKPVKPATADTVHSASWLLGNTSCMDVVNRELQVKDARNTVMSKFTTLSPEGKNDFIDGAVAFRLSLVPKGKTLTEAVSIDGVKVASNFISDLKRVKAATQSEDKKVAAMVQKLFSDGAPDQKYTDKIAQLPTRIRAVRKANNPVQNLLKAPKGGRVKLTAAEIQTVVKSVESESLAELIFKLAQRASVEPNSDTLNAFGKAILESSEKFLGDKIAA